MLGIRVRRNGFRKFVALSMVCSRDDIFAVEDTSIRSMDAERSLDTVYISCTENLACTKFTRFAFW